MSGGLQIGAVGMRAQQRALDALANNIANINTPAFKRADVRFSELVSISEEQLSGDPLHSLAGVRSDAGQRVFTQGDVRPTGSLLDFAIDGEGFVELMGPGGQTLLWRGGSLKINADGQLITAAGIPLKALINLPAGVSSFTIARDGLVLAAGDGGEAVEVGKIDLAIVRDTSALTPIGDGVYRLVDESILSGVEPGEEGSGLIIQGSLENSNVQLTNEMVSLLLIQRAFAANAQLVQAGDQMLSIVNGLKR